MVDGDKVRTLLGALMLSENLGDVHEVIDALCVNVFGIDPPEGDFIDGWADGEFERIIGKS